MLPTLRRVVCFPPISFFTVDITFYSQKTYTYSTCEYYGMSCSSEPLNLVPAARSMILSGALTHHPSVQMGRRWSAVVKYIDELAHKLFMLTNCSWLVSPSLLNDTDAASMMSSHPPGRSLGDDRHPATQTRQLRCMFEIIHGHIENDTTKHLQHRAFDQHYAHHRQSPTRLDNLHHS